MTVTLPYRLLDHFMTTQIDQDAYALLDALSSEPRDSYVSGGRLAEKTGLQPERINDAMSMLVDAGLAEWLQVFGTGPYDFGEAVITARGRYEHQRAAVAAKAAPTLPSQAGEVAAVVAASAIHPPSPVGSPYGFEDQDWEIVAERKGRNDQLRVVFGFQFASAHYDTDELKANVKATFETAIEEYHKRNMGSPITMKFKSLGAGYGGHLFNEIARDIISADIAVFDASNLNPNVMLEMGVALTWGIRVLPIKASGRPSPPSDVSGQTWVEYEASGKKFLGGDHQSKMARMIQHAIRKKGKGAT
jgi:hypothetical protein